MRRTASGLLNELEMRIARLEKQSNRKSIFINDTLRKAIKDKNYDRVIQFLGDLKRDLNPSYANTKDDDKRQEMNKYIEDHINMINTFLQKRKNTEKQIMDLQSNLSRYQGIADNALDNFESNWVEPTPTVQTSWHNKRDVAR